jgi:hypothetical protein
LAIEPEESGVNGWLAMAFDASFWRSGKDSSGVTILAGDLSVSSLEWEDGSMLKIRHAIDAIVARGAVCSVLFLVMEHKSRSLFPLGVAAHAAPRIEALGFTQMAVVARQRAAIVVLLVTSQVKACLCSMSMLKRHSFPPRRRPSGWRVAGTALARGHARVQVILGMAVFAVSRDAGEQAHIQASPTATPRKLW